MRMLVTAGPTREYFDSVRFISNPSSGKFGYAIAAQAAQRGHEVTLVSGPVTLAEPDGVRVIHVVSAQDMFEVCEALFGECDAAIMTAAVCDYRPTRRIDHKLKKQNRVRPIQLQPTPDILLHLGRNKTGQMVIGFAMEDRDHRKNAAAKLKRKQCDAMVLNGLANVGGESGEIEILRAGCGWEPPIRGTKAELAAVIVELTENLSGAVHAGGGERA